MAVKENQTVRIVPSRLMSFPSDVSRFLDRRKGGGQEAFVPFGATVPKVRVRWLSKGAHDKGRDMVHMMEDLEPA